MIVSSPLRWVGTVAAGAIVMSSLSVVGAGSAVAALAPAVQVTQVSEIRPDEASYSGWHQGAASTDSFYLGWDGVHVGLNAQKTQIIDGLVETGALGLPVDAAALGTMITGSSITIASGEVSEQVAFTTADGWGTLRPAVQAGPTSKAPSLDDQWMSSKALTDNVDPTNSVDADTAYRLGDLLAKLGAQGDLRYSAFGFFAMQTPGVVKDMTWDGTKYVFGPTVTSIPVTKTVVVPGSEIRKDETTYAGWHEGYNNATPAFSVDATGLHLGSGTPSQIINGYDATSAITNADLRSLILSGKPIVASGLVSYQVPIVYGPTNVFTTLRTNDSFGPGEVPSLSDAWYTTKDITATSVTPAIAASQPVALGDLIDAVEAHGTVTVIGFGVQSDAANPQPVVEAIDWNGVAYSFVPLTTAVTLSGPAAPVAAFDGTYTATVATTTASPDVPTGQVQFSVDGKDIGAPVDLSNGVATIRLTPAAAPSMTVGASYLGAASFTVAHATKSFDVAAAPATGPACTDPVAIDFAQGYDATAAQAPAGQNGWRAFAPYKDFGISGNALRFSNATVDGMMDQLYSPNAAVAASETGPCSTFTGSFTIASATGAAQDGLAVAVSLDNGTATRYGGTVVFHHVNGMLQVETYWLPAGVSGDNITDWKSEVLSRVAADVPHAVTMTTTTVPGDHNDILTVTLDGATIFSDVATWEAYHEAAGSDPAKYAVQTLLFRAAGSVASASEVGVPADGYTPAAAAPDLAGEGFLFSDLILNPVATSTTLSGPATSVYGADASYTATVAGAGGSVPTGAVQFSVNGTDVGAPVDLVDGKATFTLTPSGTGAVSVGAAFVSKDGFTASDATASLDVTAAPTTTTLSGATAASVGSDVSLTATVTSAAGVPTGSVNVVVDGTAARSVDLVDGKATFAVANVGLGTLNVVASYAGDANHAASSASLAIPVSYTGTANQIYIQRVYRDLFDRNPDPTGLATWTTLLNNGTPRSAVANGITYSTEYRTRLITDIYAQYLHRTPDASGLAFWLAKMANGWTVAQIESGFLGSDEFYAASGSTPAGLMVQLYGAVLNRSATQSEVAWWVDKMATGMSRQQVALGFLLSTEHLTTVVNGYYLTLLHRGIDPSGQATWVGILQAGGRDETIIAGIVASQEYFSQS